MSNFFSKRKSRIIPVILASLAIPVILCLSVPIEIYGGNMNEFLFSLSDFLPFCLALGLGAALIIAALLYFLPAKAYRFARPIIVVTALMLFIQGTFLNFGISSLPGDNLGDSGVTTAAIVINSALWIIAEGLAIASGFFKQRGKKGIIKKLCLFLSVVIIGTQLMSTAFVMLTHDQITVPKEERTSRYLTKNGLRLMTSKNLTSLGSDGNVIVFIVDRFDEDYAERAYRETPGIYSELNGFTWFQDNISLYGHTYPSVTWMLTNVPYSPEKARIDYQHNAFNDNIPLKELSDSGYNVNVFTQSYYAYNSVSDLPGYIQNVIPIKKPAKLSAGDKFMISGNVLLLSLYRCFPIGMKGLLGGINSSATENIVLEAQTENAYSLDMKKVYQDVSENEFSLNEGKNFNFIHFEGCHSVRYNENFEEPTDSDSGNYAVSVRVSFKIINKYLSEMKRLGVYDSSTIIITGDHSAPVSDRTEVTGPRLTALFVKPAGNGSEPLKISSSQVSHEDLWATVFASEELNQTDGYGTSVFDVPEGQDRVRRYVWHTYLRHSLDEYDYEVTGPSRDFTKWKEVRRQHYDKFLMD